MKRALFLLALILGSALPAAAQFDLVTGQVTDANGVPYSGATVRAQLTINGVNVTGQPTVTNASQAQCISAGLGNAPCQMPFPGTNSFTLDSSGNIPGGGINLANNPTVTPAGTQWTFTVTLSPGVPPPAGTGPQSFSVAVTVNSNPFAVGGILSGSAPAVLSVSTGAGGIPTVTSGLIGDCKLTETSGTTINCGAAGPGTLATGTGTPVFPSITSVNGTPLTVGTAQAMDNFVNASITTAGNWKVGGGSFTTGSGVLAVATNDGSGQANAAYTGLPSISANQFSMFTVSGTPGTGGVVGPAVRMSTTAVTYYGCGETNTIGEIYSRVAGAFSNLTGAIARTTTPTSGDVIILTVQENSSFNGATLICTFVSPSGAVQTISITDAQIFSGLPGIGGAGTTSINTLGQFRAGVLDTNVQGGMLFGGGQSVTLPTSLNGALSIEAYICFQVISNTNGYNAIAFGNGGGAASNAFGLVLSNVGSGNFMASGLYHLLGMNSTGIQDFNIATPDGCTSVAITYGNSIPNLNFDRIYMNGLETPSYGQGARNAMAGGGVANVYQLGGTPAGSGFTSATFYTGTIYRIRFFNRVLTPSEIQQDASALNEYMLGRGLVSSTGSNNVGDTAVAVGDSQTSGSGLANPSTQNWTQLVTLFNPPNSSAFVNGGHPWNAALGGSTVGTQQAAVVNGSLFSAPDVIADPLYTTSGNRNVIIQWLGTNDLFFQGTSGVGSSQLLDTTANYAKTRHLVGWKVIVANVISRGSGADTNFETYNPLLRQAWPQFADGYVDLASFTHFAAGGSANTTYYNADAIHPNQYGHSMVAFFMQREVNTIFGNRDWNSATTYTTTAAAATATTAGSESGQIATITFASNPFPAGACVVVAGVTPAGYNTPAGDCNLVLTSTATQITFVASVTGLGAITVQGTVVTSQEVDQDQYAILGGAAVAPNHTLETCQGRIGHVIYRMITDTNAWTITPFQASETINGGATFTTPVGSATNRPVVALKAILTSNINGGCTWQASLQ